jgi:hypothetical protein
MVTPKILSTEWLSLKKFFTSFGCIEFSHVFCRTCPESK